MSRNSCFTTETHNHWAIHNNILRQFKRTFISKSLAAPTPRKYSEGCHKRNPHIIHMHSLLFRITHWI
jgi:hypothetical protein